MKHTIIQFTATDTFNGTTSFSMTMPYDRLKSKDGYYSGLYKQVKESTITSGLVKREHISMKSLRVKGNTASVIFEFGCGVKIVMPGNVTPYDYEILLAQLRVIQMSAKP